MIDTRIELQPAFVLQVRQFRETSLLLELFTRDFGIVAVLAKGVRKAKSKTASLLQPFKELLVSFTGRSELKILVNVELATSRMALEGWGIYCGFYINELVCHFLHKQDPHPEVYADYLACLIALAKVIQQDSDTLGANATSSTYHPALEIALRVFELNLMQHVGFALATDYDIQNQLPIKESAHYFFQADQGAVEHPRGTVSGKTLQALANRQFNDAQTLAEAKQVMRHVIHFHLNGKPLKSRAIISKLQQQL